MRIGALDFAGIKARVEKNLDINNLYGYIEQMSIAPHFTPVPRQRSRHDGWSAEKQHDFIMALAEYGIVRAAAEKIGMNAASAYKLREADGAESFAAAWDKALKTGMAQLVDIAMDRAIHGVAVPHFYKGEQVGERRWFDNKLLMFMMRQTMTRRFGPDASKYDLHETALRHDRAITAKLHQRTIWLQELEADIARQLLHEEQCNDAVSAANIQTLDNCYDLVSTALVKLRNEAEA